MKIQLKRSNVLSSGAAKVPTASQLEYGELAVNYNNSDPAIFLKDSNNNVIRISGVGNISDDGLANVPDGTTPPANPEVGNLWYNSDQGRLYIYFQDTDTSQWVDASPDSWDPSSYPDVTNASAQSNTLDDRYAMVNGGNSFKTASTNSATITTFERSDSAVSSRIHYDGSDGAISLETTTNHPLAFGTNNTERLRIDSSGRVGIGTSNPSGADGSANNLVLVNASSVCGMTIRSNPANTGNIFFADGTSGSAVAEGYVQYDHPGNFLRFGTNNTERLRIDSSGRLLVGSTSARTNYFNTTSTYGPSLNIESTSNSDRVVSFVHNDGASGAPLFVLGNSGNNSTPGGTGTVVANAALGFISFQGGDGTELVEAARIQGSVDGFVSTTDMPGRLDFLTTPDGGTSPLARMRITSTGNVGIGVTSPNVNLEVNNTFRVSRNGSQGTYLELFGGSSSADPYLNVPSGFGLPFRINGSEAMRIDSAGNVGIGTSNPTVNLDCISTGSFHQKIHSGAATSYSTLQFRNSSDANAYIWQNGGSISAYGGTNSLNIVNYNNCIAFASSSTGAWEERMRILPSGGITFNGDTAQTNALDDYEEGTWVPTIFGNSAVGTANYTNNQGHYVKVGNVVHLQFYLAWNGGSGSGGHLYIGGLPFTPNSSIIAYSGVAIGYWHSVPLSAGYTPMLFVDSSSTYIHCYQIATGGGTAAPIPYQANGGGIVASTSYKTV